MSKYLLYGTRLINNDDTLEDFARCIYKGCLMENTKEESEKNRDLLLQFVEESLRDDISRTDIDYEGLLYKYRSELGDLFYLMCDRGYTIPKPEFMGADVTQFFNDIVYYYICVHYEELSREN